MRCSTSHSIVFFYILASFSASKDYLIIELIGAMVENETGSLFYSRYFNYSCFLNSCNDKDGSTKNNNMVSKCFNRVSILIILHHFDYKCRGIINAGSSRPRLSGGLLSRPAIDSRGLASRTCPRIDPIVRAIAHSCARDCAERSLLVFK